MLFAIVLVSCQRTSAQDLALPAVLLDSTEGFSLWDTRLQPVSCGRPFSIYRHADAVQLSACRGDQVCFEVAVDGPVIPERATLKVLELRGPGLIPASCVTSFILCHVAPAREGYPMIADRGAWGQDMRQSRLLPLVALMVVQVPQGSPPGTYQGFLRVELGETSHLSTNLEIRVFDFAAPPSPLELMAGLDLGALVHWEQPLAETWAQAADRLVGWGFGLMTVPPLQPLDIRRDRMTVPPVPVPVRDVLGRASRFVVPLSRAGMGDSASGFLGVGEPTDPRYWEIYGRYAQAMSARLREAHLLEKAWWEVWDDSAPDALPWIEKAVVVLRGQVPDASVVLGLRRGGQVMAQLNLTPERWLLPLGTDLSAALPQSPAMRKKVWVEADRWCLPEVGVMPLRLGLWWLSAQGLGGICIRRSNGWPVGADPASFYDPLSACLIYPNRAGRLDPSARTLTLRQWLIEGAVIQKAAELAQRLRPIDESASDDLMGLVRESETFVGPELFPAQDVSFAENYRARLFEAVERAEKRLAG